MIFLAQGTLIIFFVFLLLLGAISILGLYSFLLSFTDVRAHWTTLAFAIPSLILGGVLTFIHGFPKPGDIIFAYILAWANLLFGSLGVIQWVKSRV